VPFGALILLLGAWAFIVPLVGGYFHFGFSSNDTWQFSARQWELQLAPGIAAMVGGFMLMTPARGWAGIGALLAFLAGAWLIVGWAFYPVWASGVMAPVGHPFMRGIRWLGHLLGPGGLILLFTGVSQGVFMRRTIVEEAPPEPVATSRVVAPE
jgi:hypothetical protein